MPPVSGPELLVLHGLRLKSFATPEAVAALTRLDTDTVRSLLERFADKEWVRYREGSITGWMLLPAGRAEATKLLEEELEVTGARAEVDASYRRFLVLNQPLLQVCTDWQLREVGGAKVPNDHTDATHDANVVAELHALDAEVQPICGELASTLARFGGYPVRFAHALERLGAGELDWFTKPTIDSYHTVWFELHENLLATLGIERGSESA